MPKIFLIKNRLHQQQLRLQEQESRKSDDKDRLNIPERQDDRDHHEPLSLISRKRNNQDNNDSSKQGKICNFVYFIEKFYCIFV
jgi:hypothetical protein